MVSNRSFLLLLLIIILVFGSFGPMGQNLGLVKGAKACPLYCLVDVAYMTCPSSGDEQLSPECNCCLAPSGCVLHLSDGTSVKC